MTERKSCRRLGLVIQPLPSWFRLRFRHSESRVMAGLSAIDWLLYGANTDASARWPFNHCPLAGHWTALYLPRRLQYIRYVYVVALVSAVDNSIPLQGCQNRSPNTQGNTLVLVLRRRAYTAVVLPSQLHGGREGELGFHSRENELRIRNGIHFHVDVDVHDVMPLPDHYPNMR